MLRFVQAALRTPASTFAEGCSGNSFIFSLFPQYFILEIYKYTEKLEEFYSQHLHPYHKESTIGFL
jgi:hypothetical protein